MEKITKRSNCMIFSYVIFTLELYRVFFKVNIVYQIYDVPTFYFCIAEGEKSIEVLVEQGSILDYDAMVRYCLIHFFCIVYNSILFYRNCKKYFFDLTE